jgi:hypothetical protein
MDVMIYDSCFDKVEMMQRLGGTTKGHMPYTDFHSDFDVWDYVGHRKIGSFNFIFLFIPIKLKGIEIGIYIIVTRQWSQNSDCKPVSIQ